MNYGQYLKFASEAHGWDECAKDAIIEIRKVHPYSAHPMFALVKQRMVELYWIDALCFFLTGMKK